MADENQQQLHHFDDFHHLPNTEGNFGFTCHAEGSEPHQHKGFAEFTFIIHGEWEHLYNGHRTEMHKNSLLFFGSDVTHAWNLHSPTGNHFTFFFRQEYYDAFCKAYFPEHKELLSCKYRHTVVNQDVASFLLNEAETMLSSRRGAQHEEQFRNYLHNLIYFAFISNNVAAPSTTRHTHGGHLKVHFDHFEWLTLPLQEIYDYFPVSKSTLIKEFKEETGKTIVEYRNEKRMEYSAQLLQQWDCSIAEVAGKVGVSSLSYFSQQFKKKYGMLPKEYRLYHCW